MNRNLVQIIVKYIYIRGFKLIIFHKKKINEDQETQCAVNAPSFYGRWSPDIPAIKTLRCFQQALMS